MEVAGLLECVRVLVCMPVRQREEVEKQQERWVEGPWGSIGEGGGGARESRGAELGMSHRAGGTGPCGPQPGLTASAFALFYFTFAFKVSYYSYIGSSLSFFNSYWPGQRAFYTGFPPGARDHRERNSCLTKGSPAGELS